jgi:hypothetical protein
MTRPLAIVIARRGDEGGAPAMREARRQGNGPATSARVSCTATSAS